MGWGFSANIPPSTLSYNFTSAIAAAGDGVYTFRVTAKGDGIDYDDSNPSALSGGYAYAAPETADASNNGVTADNTDITLGGAVTLTALATGKTNRARYPGKNGICRYPGFPRKREIGKLRQERRNVYVGLRAFRFGNLYGDGDLPETGV